MPEVKEGHSTVVLMGYSASIRDALVEEIKKYKERNNKIIMLANENIGGLECLCDNVIYSSEVLMKMGNIISGMPILYAFERIMKELTE